METTRLCLLHFYLATELMPHKVPRNTEFAQGNKHRILVLNIAKTRSRVFCQLLMFCLELLESVYIAINLCDTLYCHFWLMSSYKMDLVAVAADEASADEAAADADVADGEAIADDMKRKCY